MFQECPHNYIYIYIYIHTFQVINLPEPHGECNDSAPLEYYDRYSLGACMLDCKEKQVVSVCGCRDIYMWPSKTGEYTALNASCCFMLHYSESIICLRLISLQGLHRASAVNIYLWYSLLYNADVNRHSTHFVHVRNPYPFSNICYQTAFDLMNSKFCLFHLNRYFPDKRYFLRISWINGWINNRETCDLDAIAPNMTSL